MKCEPDREGQNEPNSGGQLAGYTNLHTETVFLGHALISAGAICVVRRDGVDALGPKALGALWGQIYS